MMEGGDETRAGINVDDYNVGEAKLSASVKWLITRVYDNTVPDRLHQPFVRDEQGGLHLSPTLITVLTDGSLYTQAASKVLRDSSLVSRTLGAVLKELSTADIEVRDAEGALVTEEMLTSNEPLNLAAHLALIDALMAAHTKSIISIERVVQAISVYTSVDKREEPLDLVDALLFWINKVCLLVRDDVERQGIALKGSESGADLTIPELEDIYEDFCDGTCIAALLAFYRPDAVDIRDIYFNDPISISDCRYNLQILKDFCSNCLPWNPFHLEIDDILVLHESLQPNINAFLADLFAFFEPLPEPSPPASATSPTQRRFAPVQGIPDLRAQNLAQRPLHPPKTNRNSYGSSQRDRTMSLASADSLMTTRSGDSLRYNAAKPSNIPAGAATTNFGNLNTEGTSRPEPNGPAANLKSYAEMRLAFEEKRREHERQLALNSALKEEERVKLGKNAFFKLMSNKNPPSATAANNGGQIAQNNNNNEATSAAEPSRYEGASTARELELSAQLEDIREELKHLKMQQQQQSMSNLTNVGISHATSHPSLYNDLYPQQQAQAQQQFPASSIPPNQQQYGTLPHKSSLQYGGGFYNGGAQADPMASARAPYGGMPPYNAQQQHATVFPPHLGESSQHLYAMPNAVGAAMPPPGAAYPGAQQQPPAYYPHQTPFPLQPSTSHGHLNMLHQQSIQQQQSPFSPPHQVPIPPPHNYYGQSAGGGPMSYSMYEPNQMMNGGAVDPMSPPMMPNHPLISSDPYGMQSQQQAANQNTFRLHQPFATTSRLDPALELNRNLTNWGITYRAEEQRPPRKTWATVNADQNSTNTSSTESSNQQPHASAADNPMNNSSSSSANNQESSVTAASISHHQQTPPKDPDLRSPQEREAATNRASSTTNIRQTPTSTTFPASTSSHELSTSSAKLNNSGGGLIIAEGEEERTAEMEARRQALLLSQMKRKEKISTFKEEKKNELDERREEEMRKAELAEQRKLERELKRQKLLDDYKRKKMEQELGESMSGSMSARASVSSTGSLSRGHSQPPYTYNRPKSQSNLSAMQVQQRPNRTKSSVAGGDENGSPRITVPALADPTLKLYAKHQPKSNRSLILNALQFSVFPGAVSNEQRNKVQAALAQSNSKHFLILFRDQRNQYRGLYTWDQQSDTVYRIDGMGPKIVKEEVMSQMFKYDSGNKKFSYLPTKHLSPTIDGFCLPDTFWQKPKIPHSRGV